jgi:hypothetical protein
MLRHQFYDGIGRVPGESQLQITSDQESSVQIYLYIGIIVVTFVILLVVGRTIYLLLRRLGGNHCSSRSICVSDRLSLGWGSTPLDRLLPRPRRHERIVPVGNERWQAYRLRRRFVGDDSKKLSRCDRCAYSCPIHLRQQVHRAVSADVAPAVFEVPELSLRNLTVARS